MAYLTALARLKTVETPPPLTDKTDKTPISSVLSVPHARVSEESGAPPAGFVGFVSTSIRGFRGSPIAYTERAACFAECDRAGEAAASRPSRPLYAGERASVARLCRIEYGSADHEIADTLAECETTPAYRAYLLAMAETIEASGARSSECH